MRPDVPVPLTAEEHQELALELRNSRVRLRELCSMVMSVYGPNSNAAFAFRKVTDGMERLCGELQAQAARDCPGSPVDGLYL